MNAIDRVLTDIRERSVHILATDAGCYSPDTNESPGAKFLDSVRREFLEVVESERADLNTYTDLTDRFSEIADGAPDVYTHTRWSEFVDLGAYNEEPEGGDVSDMTGLAALCLYEIASRLVDVLWGEVEEAITEAQDEESDE